MRAELVMRPARPEDKATVVEFTKTIWGGDDYLPKVWDEWLADQDGRLFVGEFEGRVVATGKITRLTPKQGWLEGLRVDPAFQGRGFASQVQNFVVAAGWAMPGIERVGLSTSAQNQSVYHLALRSGMDLICEFRYLSSPAPQLPEQAAAGSGGEPGAGLAEDEGISFLTGADLPAVVALLQHSPDLAAMDGHCSDGWSCPWLLPGLTEGDGQSLAEVPPTTLETLRALLAEGRIVGQRRGEVLQALIVLGSASKHTNIWLGLCAGDPAGVTAMARFLVRRLPAHAKSRVRAMIPLGSPNIAALRAAGFSDPEKGEFDLALFEAHER
jgi:RimJ/RimL family protein N-acetyltransferase